jgi:hypothetical protein
VGQILQATSECFADLIVVPAQGHSLRVSLSSGEHYLGGMPIAAGGGIPHEKLNHSVSILYFVPTLSTLLGAELSDSDRRILPELTQAVR